MPGREEGYVTKLVTKSDFDRAVEVIRSSFGEQGFGVLTEIDVSGTMKSKIGVDMPRYRLLGMCNPTLAHRALMLEPDIGVMLPCNVAVYEQDESTVVSVQDPGTMVELSANMELEEVAGEASDGIQLAMRKVMDQLL